MLKQKGPSKKKNIILISILGISVLGIVFMLWQQSAPVSVPEVEEGGSLSTDFILNRKIKKVKSILQSLDFPFIEYDVYKRLSKPVPVPEVTDDEVGNDLPFQIQEFFPQSF
ncbi:MAG: hypothetical protein ACKKL5_03670 [Candidatus Komeilibacteria bacterium]